MHKRVIFSLLAALLWVGAHAQKSAYTSYIDTYKDLAIDHMKRYGIPASITLAQGLLESGAGRSTLASTANNHFGIKCGSSWRGPYVLRDDDAPNEKFRAYKSARDSYEDHARFLTSGQRYAFLFNYDTTDYVSWARGLKKAGYATNPAYADQLISIIRQYDLARYDKASRHGKWWQHHRDAGGRESDNLSPDFDLQVRMCNENYYVVARPGDTFESVSRTTGVSERKLRRYNEVDKDYRMQPGDIVYLEKKRSKAARSLGRRYRHTIAAGESLYSIAQTYGIRLKTLYKNNHLPDDYVASVGDELRIR